MFFQYKDKSCKQVQCKYNYYFVIIGSSLMVELSIEFLCKLSCQNSLPVQQKSVPCRLLLMIGIGKNVKCLPVFIFLLFILLFFCCRLSSTQRILTFLCKMFLVKSLIIHWSNSINKGVFVVNWSMWLSVQDDNITVPKLKM